MRLKGRSWRWWGVVTGIVYAIVVAAHFGPYAADGRGAFSLFVTLAIGVLVGCLICLFIAWLVHAVKVMVQKAPATPPREDAQHPDR